MKLSDQERNIILGAQLRADQPIRVIAEHTGYREHVVRHCLKRLEERGVISPYPFIDTFALGFQTASIFFSLAASGKRRQAVLRGLLDAPQVSWLDECTGEFQYSVAIQIRSIAEVSDFLEALSSKFARVFSEKAVSFLVSGALFPRRYLATKEIAATPLFCGNTRTLVDVDDLDHTILAALSQLPYRSYRDLARRIGMPESTLKHRIARLQEQKVISGFCYAVHPETFGFSDYYYLISANASSQEFKRRLYDFCLSHPHIYAFMSCVGPWDYECKADLPSGKEAAELTGSLYDAFAEDISSVKVLQYRRSKKIALYPFARMKNAVP